MSSRPSAARRRFHRDRMIAKRLAQARKLSWIDPAEFQRGRLANEQWYLGCHRAGCAICHTGKDGPNAERQHAERQWRQIEQLARDES